MSWTCFLCYFQSREGSSGSGIALTQLLQGWLWGGEHWGASWGHLYPLQVTCILQNLPDLLGSELSPFGCRSPSLLPPAKLFVQDVTCCLLLSQKFTSSFFLFHDAKSPEWKGDFMPLYGIANLYWASKDVFIKKISTAANFPKSQTIITHLVLDRGFFWIFPPDPVIKAKLVWDWRFIYLSLAIISITAHNPSQSF